MNQLQITGRDDQVAKCLKSIKTSWNAQQGFYDHDTIVAEEIPTGAEMWFDTAGYPPWPVLLELSKKFPELEFHLCFVIEGIGKGLVRCKNGEELSCNCTRAGWESPDWL
jgi:hypothetical protein